MWKQEYAKFIYACIEVSVQIFFADGVNNEKN